MVGTYVSPKSTLFRSLNLRPMMFDFVVIVQSNLSTFQPIDHMATIALLIVFFCTSSSSAGLQEAAELAHSGVPLDLRGLQRTHFVNVRECW